VTEAVQRDVILGSNVLIAAESSLTNLFPMLNQKHRSLFSGNRPAISGEAGRESCWWRSH